jgi:type II secretory pathway pseudopilin PulG
MQRRPVFLLEIIIAMALVGLFASFFLRSTIQSLYKERDALAQLELDRLYNMRRMEVIRICLQQFEKLPRNQKEAATSKKVWETDLKALEAIEIGGKKYKPKSLVFEAWIKQGAGDTYKLVLKENKTKYYFVFKKAKSEAKA